MKLLRSSIFLCALLIFGGVSKLCAQKKSLQDPGKSSLDFKSKSWQLVFADKFNKTGSIDDAKWSYSRKLNRDNELYLRLTTHIKVKK